MRDIRFRAWDKEAKKFHDNEIDNMCMDYESGLPEWGDNYYRRDSKKIIFSQYTGLKDKNGKGGYESDFFKDKHGFVYRIEHDMDGWIFVNGDVGYRPSTFKTSVPYSLDGEFIGNSFENPELLEDKNAKG